MDDVIDVDGVVRAAVSRPDAVTAMQEDVMEAERLFLVWMQADDRRVNTLAEATGIPATRVRRYLRHGGFQERYLEATDRFRKAAQPYAQALAAEQVDAVIQRLATIVETGGDSDAIAASRLILKTLEGTSENDKPVVNIDVRVLQAAGEIVSQGKVTPAAGMKMLRAQLAQNVDDTTEQMNSKRQ